DPPLVAAASETGFQPQRHDFIGKAEGDDAPAHREDVGVVVLARQPRGIEIVAQRGANPAAFVCGDLLALAAAADDDTAIGAAADHTPRDGGADRRIVHVLFRVG